MFDRKKYKTDAFERSKGLPKKMFRVSLVRVFALIFLYAVIYVPYYVKKYGEWNRDWKETVSNAQGSWDESGGLHEFQSGEEINAGEITSVYSYGDDGTVNVQQKQRFLEYVKKSQTVFEQFLLYFVRWAYAFVFSVIAFAVSFYVFSWRKNGDFSFDAFVKCFSGASLRGAAWYSLWCFILLLPMMLATLVVAKLAADGEAAVATEIASTVASLRAGIAVAMSYAFLAYSIFVCIKLLGYSMMRYVLAENPNIGAVRAMKLSKKMCKGCRENILVMDLSFFLWWVFSILTLGFGFILFMPYLENSFINAYEAIKKNSIESGVLKEEDFDVLQ
ncbi:MAG: DUF975 family protein [Treponema sp.]|nr:DUF975 family protein [Treponema sp.]